MKEHYPFIGIIDVENGKVTVTDNYGYLIDENYKGSFEISKEDVENIHNSPVFEALRNGGDTTFLAIAN